MFTGISWATYGTAVAAALAVYYLFVGFKCYFTGARAVFKKKSGIQIQAQDEDPQEHIVQPAVQALTEKLAPIIRTASGSQELKQLLHSLLKEYPSFKNSPVKSSVNKLIVALCDNNPSVTLHEEEVELLWNGIA